MTKRLNITKSALLHFWAGRNSTRHHPNWKKQKQSICSVFTFFCLPLLFPPSSHFLLLHFLFPDSHPLCSFTSSFFHLPLSLLASFPPEVLSAHFSGCATASIVPMKGILATSESNSADGTRLLLNDITRLHSATLVAQSQSSVIQNMRAKVRRVKWEKLAFDLWENKSISRRC